MYPSSWHLNIGQGEMVACFIRKICFRLSLSKTWFQSVFCIGITKELKYWKRRGTGTGIRYRYLAYNYSLPWCSCVGRPCTEQLWAPSEQPSWWVAGGPAAYQSQPATGTAGSRQTDWTGISCSFKFQEIYFFHHKFITSMLSWVAGAARSQGFWIAPNPSFLASSGPCSYFYYYFTVIHVVCTENQGNLNFDSILIFKRT